MWGKKKNRNSWKSIERKREREREKKVEHCWRERLVIKKTTPQIEQQQSLLTLIISQFHFISQTQTHSVLVLFCFLKVSVFIQFFIHVLFFFIWVWRWWWRLWFLPERWISRRPGRWSVRRWKIYSSEEIGLGSVFHRLACFWYYQRCMFSILKIKICFEYPFCVIAICFESWFVLYALNAPCGRKKPLFRL